MNHAIESFGPTNRGRFLSEEEEIRHKSRLSRRPEDIDGVKFYEQEFTMQNGSHYHVTSTVLPEVTRATGIASIETSAWLTRYGGLNKRRQLALGKMGVESTFVSVPQNLFRFGSLEENARHQLRISQETARQFDRDPNYVFINGISRGAMTGLGAAAIASRYNMGVMYGDYIVPCFPNGVNPRQDLQEVPDLLANEIDPIYSLKQIPWRALRHYPSTVDHSPRELFQQLKEVPTLLSGSVGTLIDTELPEDSFGYVTAYEGDVMSQGRRWQEKLNPSIYPNMLVDLQRGGGHLSCAGVPCYDGWLGRMQAVTEAVSRYESVLKDLGPSAGPSMLHDILTTDSAAFGASAKERTAA